ncbi:MAG: alanine racemase [Kiritimatiellae bacterium]|nr:alanine racemase [Kiritimatiellia bacterium]
MKKSWVEIDLSILEDNIERLKQAVNGASEIVFVVKADAYGHGAPELAKCAFRAGVRWFAVAYVEEALKIRETLTEGTIVVLGVADPAEAPLMAQNNIIPIVADLEHGMALSRAAQEAGVRLSVHVKIDTGMGRIGLPMKKAPEQLNLLEKEPGLNITGMCSHFAMVEASEPQAARTQAKAFKRLASDFEKKTGRILFKHLSSSRAILYHPEWQFDGIRPGIMLYGYGAQDEDMRVNTRPFLQWKGVVMQVKSVPANFSVGYYCTYVTSRPTDIGIIACGYADGYLRALSNRGHVLIQGRRCPVVGRVSMNWLAVDIGPKSGVKRGDEVVFVGEQGNEAIWANELAALCRTIPYEILTCINAGIKRVYKN